MARRKVPDIAQGRELRLIDTLTGENYVFTDPDELALFKYQRYMMRYLQTIAAIDENVGRLLDYLDAEGLTDDTIVIYTSDHGERGGALRLGVERHEELLRSGLHGQ